MTDKELIEELQASVDPQHMTDGDLVILEAASRLRELTELRSMDTAPRDGTRILIGNGHGWRVGFWRGYYQDSIEGQWITTAGADWMPFGWLPLPALPETQEAGR